MLGYGIWVTIFVCIKTEFGYQTVHHGMEGWLLNNVVAKN
jgi:hypothetical protein